MDSDTMQPMKIGDGGASISIRMENLIASSIMEKLEIRTPSGRCSIHRVPKRFHKMREPSAYKPGAVSIGPYHRANQSLKATEDLKLLYARNLLTVRARRESSRLYALTIEEEEEDLFAIVEECVSSITEMETEIRMCYSESVEPDSKKFVEMMIIDGLFIIKMLIRYKFCKYNIADDPLDSNDWLLMMVEQDMFLLENQIPLFVLQCLAKIIINVEESGLTYLNKVIHSFIMDGQLPHILPANQILLEEPPKRCEDANHLLDFFIKLINPKRKNPSDTSTDFFLPSATELSLAGVRFKKGSAQGSFLDIKFNRRTGILKIPPLCIYDETDPLLRNLIACEQSYGGGYHITSYVSMMDFLINSADDVKLLRKEEIISNYLGCDEDVSEMFNKLGVGIILDSTYYSNYINDINKFYKKRWHRWKATLKREYFNSPWAIVSVLAAILVIALTIISTVFGILSFVFHK